MKTKNLFPALVLVAVAAIGFVALAGGKKVGGEEAKKHVAAGAAFIDVRSPEEFDAEHLPGARNIPVDQLDKRLAEVGPKDKPVVVYCRSGSRSARAANLLASAGFKEVYDLGSYQNWK